MKNLLNRLTRFMIIMLMLVDRTPFLNVYAKPGDVIDFSMSKFDVSADFTVSNNWTLEKTVSPSILNLNIGQSANVVYTVKATKTTIYTFNIIFDLTMTNLTNTERTFDLIAYVQSTNGQTVYGTGTVAEKLVVPASGNLSGTYGVELNVNAEGFKVPFKIEVGVANTNFTNNEINGERTAAVNSIGTPTGSDSSITVNDSMSGVGPWTFNDDATVTYTKTYASDPVPGTRTIDNTIQTQLVSGTLSASASVVVNTLNQSPTANNQLGLSTDEDTALPITLSGSDPDGHALTYIIVSDPSKGSLSGSGSAITYTPDKDYNGPDSFTFKVVDIFGAESNVATVSIVVGPVNDAPVAEGDKIFVDEND